jgi:hypothetical protein
MANPLSGFLKLWQPPLSGPEEWLEKCRLTEILEMMILALLTQLLVCYRFHFVDCLVFGSSETYPF